MKKENKINTNENEMMPMVKKYEAISFDDAIGFNNNGAIKYSDTVSNSLNSILNVFSPESQITKLHPNQKFGYRLSSSTIDNITTLVSLYISNNVLNYYSAVVNAFFNNTDDLIAVSEELLHEFHSCNITEKGGYVNTLCNTIYNIATYTNIIMETNPAYLNNMDNYVCIFSDAIINLNGIVDSTIYSVLSDKLRILIYSYSGIEYQDKDKSYYYLLDILTHTINDMRDVFRMQLQKLFVYIISGNIESLKLISDMGEKYDSFRSKFREGDEF